MADSNYIRAIGEFFGTLSAGVTALDTTLQSLLFADTTGSTVLPVIGANDPAVRLVLVDDTTRTYEIVYITAHAAGAATVTVVRGREGTTALAWPPGTVIRCAPTPRDAVLPASTADLAALVASTSPPHIGMDAADLTEGRPKFATKGQGFVARVGALPMGAPNQFYGNAVTTDLVPLVWPGLCLRNTSGGPASGGAVTVFTDSMTYLDAPVLPRGVIISCVTTKAAANANAAFSAAHFCGAEVNNSGTRLWFVCVNYSGGRVGNGLYCPFSVLLVGA